jgi:hypothetical protein
MRFNRSIPITRINKFFSEEDFKVDISMGREALEGDGNFIVILYNIDRNNSQFDDLYGEAVEDGIRFLPPVELKVVPIISEHKNEVYNKDEGSLRYIEDGLLTFSIYEQQLLEHQREINYGDYIGFMVTEEEIVFFSVVDDGVKNYDNKHTIMGYKEAFRTIVCTPIDENEFKGV